VAGDATVAAAEAIACTATASIRETNQKATSSDDAASACSAKDVTDPTTPTHVDIHAPQENTTRKERCSIGKAEKDWKKTETPPKSSEAKNYSHTKLPRNIMYQPEMRTQRQYRTKNPTRDIIKKTKSYGNSKKNHSIASTLRRGGGNPCMKKRKQLDCPDPAEAQHHTQTLILYPAHGRNSSTSLHLQRHGI